MYKQMNFQQFKEHREAHPDYKVFWRSGLAFRGAIEVEVDTSNPNFMEAMESKFNWACLVEVKKEDPVAKELHLNGFSVLDME